ncbi:hypothetical protein DPEC_G00357150 [Dallia pectoralis]|uniref:Uncharacterized protein n=1 Tax=Dallia pectoralis TaxID=75939 RepID=A0ACC2F037_DALPE|nr:hypothetical protein DPEC_G00357150 [Dallia pectoralis]
MEARVSVVETLAEFGCFSPTSTAVQMLCSWADVFICSGCDEVYVFNRQERILRIVLQFQSPVNHIAFSVDKQRLYAVSDGVFCISIPSLPFRPPSDQSPGPSLFQVSDDFLVAREEGVCSVVEVEGSKETLVTVSLREAAWWFTLYAAASYKKLTQFSLPAVSVGLHDDFKENVKLVMRPVLACIYSNDAPPQSSTSKTTKRTSSSTSPPATSLDLVPYLLEPLLFKLLFGVDAAFANSPVILCGLPDGRLCYFPLCLPSQAGPRVRVLHSLEQPIIFMGTSTGTNGGQQCFVAVGRSGTVALVRIAQEGTGEGGKVAGFTERCVSGPVVCVCAGRKGLYYSTGSDLLALDVPGEREDDLSPGGSLVVGRGEMQGQTQARERPNESGSLKSPVSLNVCRVVALVGPCYNASGTVQLLALSHRGRLHQLTLSNGTEGAGTPRLSSSQVGQRVKDLLASVGDVCERASLLKSTIRSKNNSLRRLNQILNVCCLLLANRTDGENCSVSAKPIRCHIVAKWSRLLQRDSLILTCVLDNSSPYVLERGWTFCVQVVPLTIPLSEGGENVSRTFSFPVQELEQSRKMEVLLPVGTAGDTFFPVTVICSLNYSLQSLLGPEELASLLANGDLVSCLGLDGGWFSLALDTLTVDWLDALQMTTTMPHHSDPKSPSVHLDTGSMGFVKAFLCSHRIRGSGTGDGEGEGMVASEDGLFKASIKVSTELLRSALGLEPQCPVGPGGPKSPAQGVCASVLRWLLSQGPERDNWRNVGNKGGPEGSVVCAYSPGGYTVKIAVNEVPVVDTGVKDAVEVQVQCSSMTDLCGLHHAVLSRVQTLLQGAAAPQETSMGVQGLGLRQALHRAQALYEQIQEARIPEAIGHERTTGRTTETLFGIYRQLRDHPLLIL